jgi:predicted glycosyltransferase involved in capsule biosynthesis
MCKRFRRRPDISIIVPFRDNGEHRTRVWHWLKRYYEANLPSVEVVVGTEEGVPFSKSVAVNRAAKRARGKIFVILDADALIQADKLQTVCDDLILDRRLGRKTWAMPYERIFYISREATEFILEETRPEGRITLHSPPGKWWQDGNNNPLYGHPFGAMALAMPREAFFAVGGMDPRFRGWGGEDVSFLHALDTLWGLHTVADNDVWHLWHERPGRTAATRKWVGQPEFGPINSRIAHRYNLANGEPGWMQALVDEHRPRPWWRRK